MSLLWFQTRRPPPGPQTQNSLHRSVSVSAEPLCCPTSFVSGVLNLLGIDRHVSFNTLKQPISSHSEQKPPIDPRLLLSSSETTMILGLLAAAGSTDDS